MRRRHLQPTDPEIAQSYVSLGNLMSSTERNEEALQLLKDGLAVYQKGLGYNHPKVAWAHEGIAKVLMKCGELDEAQKHVDEALRIRSSLQEVSEGLKLFGHEMDMAKDMRMQIIERRGRSSSAEPLPPPKPEVAAAAAAQRV